MTPKAIERAMAVEKKRMERAEKAIGNARCILAQFDAEDAYDIAHQRFIAYRNQLVKINEVTK